METRRLEADPAGIAAAADLLGRGRLAAFPTETVYGLGADARSGAAVAGIYEAKGRPSFNPLIAHVADLAAARREGAFGEAALRLAAAFWPGPLTLVVPMAERGSVCDLARAGLDSVGLRVPAHPVAQALLRAVDAPVAAPSANRSGRISPTAADHVVGDLAGCIDAVLDGGPSEVGLESTIVACRAGRVELLRPGGIARAEIEAVLGHPLDAASAHEAEFRAPGMLASHYAPRAGVRLEVREAAADEHVLDFAEQLSATPGLLRLDLSPGGDLREAAATLFGHLRRLDAAGAVRIAVAPVPRSGLGEAINDRLARAAAPRS